MALDKKRCILFCPAHQTSFHKLLQIAESVYVNEKIVFLIANTYSAKNTSLINEKGFEYVYVNHSFEQKSTLIDEYEVLNNHAYQKVKKIFEKIRSELRVLKKIPFFRTFFEKKRKHFIAKLKKNLINEYIQYDKDIRCVFEKVQPTLIVSAGDRTLSHQVVVHSVAKLKGVKIVIPPISAISGSHELAQIKYENNGNAHVSRDLQLREKFPKQFFPSKNGTQVSFYPVWMIETLHSLNCLPSSPWVLGESFADLVMVEGAFQESLCLSLGLNPKKIQVVGDTELDSLYQSYSESKHFNDLVKKNVVTTVVMALPQMYEHGLLSFEEHWQLMKDLCNGVTDNGLKLIVSLHPKMPLARYKPLEDIMGVEISLKPLREILVQADIFVATNGSSTWLWATLCGIPTVLCDWSGLDYDFINTQSLGVRVIRSKDDYCQYIRRLSNDFKFYSNQRMLQVHGGKDLALFDGKAAERMHLLFNKMSQA